MKKEYKLYVYDAEQKATTDRFLPLDKKRAELLSFSQKNNLSSSSDKIYFYESFLKNIFVFSDGKLTPYIEFEDNGYLMPESKLDAKHKGLRAFIKMCKASGNIWGDINYYFLNGKVYSMFQYESKLYYNIMNLQNDGSQSYSYVKDDAVLDAAFTPKDFVLDIVGTTDDALILSVDSYKLNKIKMQEAVDATNESPDEINPKLLLLYDRKIS